MNARLLKFSVAAILMLILFFAAIAPLLHRTARAGEDQYVNWTSKKGFPHVACSADGRYVYVVGDEAIVRSADYGKKGTWEKVLGED